jgi:hypothetical protein
MWIYITTQSRNAEKKKAVPLGMVTITVRQMGYLIRDKDTKGLRN